VWQHLLGHESPDAVPERVMLIFEQPTTHVPLLLPLRSSCWCLSCGPRHQRRFGEVVKLRPTTHYSLAAPYGYLRTASIGLIAHR
jgi:hypothetical protein